MICWKRPWNLSCFQLFLEYRCWNRKYVIRTLWIIKYFRITYCNLKVNSKANNQIVHKLWSICIQLHNCHMNIQCRNSKAFHQDNNSFFVLVTNHLADLHLHPQKQHSTGWNWINDIFDLWIYLLSHSNMNKNQIPFCSWSNCNVFVFLSWELILKTSNVLKWLISRF